MNYHEGPEGQPGHSTCTPEDRRYWDTVYSKARMDGDRRRRERLGDNPQAPEAIQNILLRIKRIAAQQEPQSDNTNDLPF